MSPIFKFYFYFEITGKYTKTASQRSTTVNYLVIDLTKCKKLDLIGPQNEKYPDSIY